MGAVDNYTSMAQRAANDGFGPMATRTPGPIIEDSTEEPLPEDPAENAMPVHLL